MDNLEYPHLTRDQRGRAILSGTTTKVSEIVLDYLAHRWSADDIAREHPHLDLAQIHSAFAYYYDHQTEIDAEIAEELRIAREIRGQLDASSIREKLLALLANS